MRIITAIVIAISMSACTHNWGNLRRVSLDAPKDMKEVGSEVTGKDCGIFGQWYNKNLQAAAQDALAQAPGAKGLRDVTVEGTSMWIYNCMVVRGTPVK